MHFNMITENINYSYAKINNKNLKDMVLEIMLFIQNKI